MATYERSIGFESRELHFRKWIQARAMEGQKESIGMIFIDFETRSELDLKKVGTSVYARHPSTDVLCMAYSIKPDIVDVWKPSDEYPLELFHSVFGLAKFIEAHNAFFERNIWEHVLVKRYGFPPIPDDRWRCSLAACCRLALPRSLGDACEALSLPIQKDVEGAKLMRRLCKPQRTTELFDTDPMKLERLYEYCQNDVKAEVGLSSAIEPLTKAELQVWQLDQKINLKGIPVDLSLVRKAIEMVNAIRLDFSDDLNRITEGAVSTPKQVQELRKFIEENQGEPIPDLSIETVETWLEREDLNPAVKSVLEIRAEASGSAVSKLESMIDRADTDGRVRGNILYHGAATGRFSGSGLQIHNFPRGKLSPAQIEVALDLIAGGNVEGIELILGSPLDVVKSCLRAFIKAEKGKRLIAGDFASIEARVLAWVAGEDDLLTTFAMGGDVYKGMASKIYEVSEAEVTKQQRHIGKTAILGLGYGMGYKAFKDACKAMAGVEVSTKFAKVVVSKYREANPKIKAFWAELNQACIKSVAGEGPQRVGRLETRLENGVLTIKLPSGRKLHYNNVSLIKVRAPWSEGYTGAIECSEADRSMLEDLGVEFSKGSKCRVPSKLIKKIKAEFPSCQLEPCEPEYIDQIQYYGVNSVTRKWSKLRTYGGKLVENVVQAIARDFLASAMLRIDRAGYDIIATIHDEILCEVQNDFGSLGEFGALMKESPTWGKGCPIDVECFESERYRK